MSAHTPGPWTVEDARRVLGSTDYGRSVMRDAEVEANARLIAAAPDMLEALRGVSRFMKTTKVVTRDEAERVYDAVDAAIAKAEG